MVVCLSVCKIGYIFCHVHDLVRFTLALCFYASVQPKKGAEASVFRLSVRPSVCTYMWRLGEGVLRPACRPGKTHELHLFRDQGRDVNARCWRLWSPKGWGKKTLFHRGGSYWTSLWTRERSKPYLSPCFNAKGQTKLKTFHRFTL